MRAKLIAPYFAVNGGGIVLSRIRIPSTWATGHGTADFKLGLGPCGKIVKQLRCWNADSCFSVEQVCDDGEMKIFHYPFHTITGRIEETYA